MPVGRRVTLLTLARDLGISRASVSNAYNRPDQLSPALRARILARAAELGFSGPDPVARGLRRGRVGAIGVLVDQGLSYAFSDPVAVLFLDGLAREVQEDGFGLLLHAGTAAESGLALIANAPVDGWVVQSMAGDHPAVAVVQALARPLVVLDQPALPGVPLVAVDDDGGAASAARHLLDLGHTRLGVLTMPLCPDGRWGLADPVRRSAATYPVMRRRLDGVARAVADAGLDWATIPVVECAANDPEAGATGAALILGVDEAPTAILALSDQLALGVLRAARDHGLTVPDQLSLVGFDDAPPARHAEPPLTTVAQPLLARGQAVGVLMRALLSGEQVVSPEPFATRLVVRASTAPPGTGRLRRSAGTVTR
jgi:DNA-binding LacI/PurR family transcriptional regulator